MITRAFVAFDNFLFSESIVAALPSAIPALPLQNIRQMDPDAPVHVAATSALLSLTLSTTGPRKPNFAAIGKHNLTKDATVKVQAAIDSGFGSISAEDVLPVAADVTDHSSPARPHRIIGKRCPNIAALDDADKAFVRLNIADAGNTDSFIRLGRVFIGTRVELSFNAIDVGKKEDFVDESEEIASSEDDARHTRPRRVYRTLEFTVVEDRISGRAGLRKVLRYCGSSMPVWIGLNDDDDEEDEYATQLYYGFFSKLPDLSEERYVRGESGTLIKTEFDFEELV